MTFGCVWWEPKPTDYTRDLNVIEGNKQGNWLAVEAVFKNDQMLMKCWGICKLLQGDVSRMETPLVDCGLQQQSDVLAMTFCNPIDDWQLKKRHGLSTLLLHCESPFCVNFVFDFEFLRLMHKESGQNFLKSRQGMESQAHEQVHTLMGHIGRVWDLHPIQTGVLEQKLLGKRSF